MQIVIQPSAIKGSLQAPASKSSMQRACAAALLHRGKTILQNAGHSHDDRAALQVIQALGATVDFLPGEVVHIHSRGLHPVSAMVSMGESGLGMRMFTPIIALSDTTVTITGEGSLPGRPMDFFDEVLPRLGVTVVSNEGRLPLQITGPLIPQDVTVDGSLSSQFLTGLLMAFAAGAHTPVTITVNNLKSKPYIDLTLRVLEDFGYRIANKNHISYTIQPAYYDYHETINYTVESDWSSAAFLLVAGAVAGEVEVHGMDMFSTQADKAIMQALSYCGAALQISGKMIYCAKGALEAFEFDATDCPDLFPPLAALAAYCEGITVITGVHRLQHKESDRALTLQEEFAKMGVKIELQDDAMLIHGGAGVSGALVHSHNDHRIAMACAVAGLSASGETHISGAAAVNKSYPDFYRHLQSLGASLQEPERV
jgi:3-phosphoshikimate 1-carboxyvinyltransferase